MILLIKVDNLKQIPIFYTIPAYPSDHLRLIESLCNFPLLLPSIPELVQLLSTKLLLIPLVGVSLLFRFRKNFAYYYT